MASRTYLLGLPVAVTVDEEAGLIALNVDTTEVGVEIARSEDTDEEGRPIYTDAEILLDSQAADQALLRNAERIHRLPDDYALGSAQYELEALDGKVALNDRDVLAALSDIREDRLDLILDWAAQIRATETNLTWGQAIVAASVFYYG